MPILERLLSIGPVRQGVWRCWYPFLTRRLREEDVVFLNYAFESDPPLGLVLDPGDEPNRACIQLYHHVASQVELRGREVLEVSCGHGGGASFITRTRHPAQYTGLDLNPAGIRFCRRRHQGVERLSFVQGDAQRLPFADASVDVVVNVEASHCYPDFDAFLAEVARVLRPGGHCVYADFRFREEVAAWERALDSAPLRQVTSQDIRDEVLRGMEVNAGRSGALVRRHLPGWLQPLGRDFAGLPGSRIYEALKAHEVSYRSWCLVKE